MDDEVPSKIVYTITGSHDAKPSIILTTTNITEYILKLLPARNLSICAQVCTWWNETVKSIMNKRRQIYILEKISYPSSYINFYQNIENIWVKPDTILTFGDQSKCWFTKGSIVALSSPNSFEDEEALRQQCTECQRENCLPIKHTEDQCPIDHLPKKYELKEIPAKLISKNYRDDGMLYASEISIFIPRISGIKIRSFPIFLDEHRYYLFKSETFDLSNLSEAAYICFSKIKFAVIFASNSFYLENIVKLLRDTETTSESEHKIIIGGTEESGCINTALTFAGEDVWIKFNAIFERECCAREHLRFIKNTCLPVGMEGMAFLVSQSFDFPIHIVTACYEIFPTIKTFGLWFTKIRGVNLTTDPHFCEKCSQQSTKVGNENMCYFVLILLKNTILTITEL